jgi:DNA mismatch repair protein MutS2
MDIKSINKLEFPKVLEQLAINCSFDVSKELALDLAPTGDVWEARKQLAETSEAVRLLTLQPDFSIGGARDIREKVELANRGGILEPADLLDIKYTLVSARNLSRMFNKFSDDYPILFNFIDRLPEPTGIVDAISKVVSDHGEILDSASLKLAQIRRDLQVVHGRLLTKLQRIVGDQKNSKYLQEAIITQRDGRYVIPIKSDFKGKIRAIVHDQSASGATLYIEPTVAVELNNRYRELQLSEKDEVRRILAELSDVVGLNSQELFQLVGIIAELDLILAKAKYADKLEAFEPKLHEIEMSDGRSKANARLNLYQARHPLLDPDIVVPIDVVIDSGTYAVVITGPNTGGKTVTLKTVGLLVLMAQAGLHIPAHSGSEIGVFNNIFSDIGDEQSIEQSLSTFSSHITNIIRILDEADQTSLVFLDELGAGTDPVEGAALARALLDHLVLRGITTIVTTHHPELKLYAHSTPGVMNASVEFDLETLKPTYRLNIGLPGRSNALAIAKRLGLPGIIVDAARSEINPDDLKVDDLLDEIIHQRDLTRRTQIATDELHKEVEALRYELLEQLRQIDNERKDILEEARSEADDELQRLKVEIRRVRSQLEANNAAVLDDDIKAIAKEIDEIEVRKKANHQSELDKYETEIGRPIKIGDKVVLKTLGSAGVVSSISGDEAEIRIGVMRVRTQISEIVHVKDTKNQIEKKVQKNKRPAKVRGDNSGSKKDLSANLANSPGVELDLRGKRADEAEAELERYLDAAYYVGMPFVRIIHGKGTGKLRTVVREFLSSYSQVRSFEGGREKEGGDGVTVVKF